MKHTLKLLALLSVGLFMAGPKGPDGDSTPTTPNGNDPADRQRAHTPNGTSAITNWPDAAEGINRNLGQGEAKDSDNDGTPDLANNSSLPTRADLPPFNISTKQFGKKWGKHAKDYDLNPGDPESRQWFQDRATNVHDNPDDVRVGPYNPEGGGGPDYVFFRQGDDLVIMKPNGDFVTMFPMEQGNYNGWYNDATPIQ